jgi:hypothetical protein
MVSPLAAHDNAKQKERRHTIMPLVGFEYENPLFVRSKFLRILNRVTTRTCILEYKVSYKETKIC